MLLGTKDMFPTGQTFVTTLARKTPLLSSLYEETILKFRGHEILTGGTRPVTNQEGAHVESSLDDKVS